MPSLRTKTCIFAVWCGWVELTLAIHYRFAVVLSDDDEEAKQWEALAMGQCPSLA